MKENSNKISTVAIIGNTTWGQALAHLIQNTQINILCRTKDESENRTNKINQKIPLSDNIILSSDTNKVLTESDLLILTFPSQTTRYNLNILKPYIKLNHKILIASKGIEKTTGKRISEMISEELPQIIEKNIAVISGPNLANEIYNKKSTSTVIATHNQKLFMALKNILESRHFKIYSSNDIIGVELGGALKNIVTIGAGICDGLKLGNNLKGAFISVAFSEIVKLATIAGAQPLTISGLSGLGDTLASSYSPLSRNRRAGQLIGERNSISAINEKINNIVEGIDTLYGAKNLADTLSHDSEFIELMIKVCHQELDPLTLIRKTIGEV